MKKPVENGIGMMMREKLLRLAIRYLKYKCRVALCAPATTLSESFKDRELRERQYA
jgi:hypothetical protein